MMRSLWKIISVIFISSCCKTDHNKTHVSAQCTRSPPAIVGYSKHQFQDMSAPSYKFTWRLERCNPENIIQYEVQFTGNCSTTPPVTISARSNETSITFSIPTCEEGNCFVRIRAELTDGLFTDYSACARINNQFFENKKLIEQYFQDVCVPIQGVCSSGAASEFFINDDLTLWPGSNTLLYNVTYSSDSRMYHFCFYNITESVVITEFCYQDHSPTVNCSLCSDKSGEIIFQSRSEISLKNPTRSNFDIDTTNMSSLAIDTVTRITSHEMNMKGESLSLLTIIGAISISTLCILIGMILLMIPIILWYKKKSGCPKSNQDNIYDEPSFPDPTRQEVNVGLTYDTTMETTGNEAYNPIAVMLLDSDANVDMMLDECPAYGVKHQDVQA